MLYNDVLDPPTSLIYLTSPFLHVDHHMSLSQQQTRRSPGLGHQIAVYPSLQHQQESWIERLISQWHTGSSSRLKRQVAASMNSKIHAMTSTVMRVCIMRKCSPTGVMSLWIYCYVESLIIPWYCHEKSPVNDTQSHR
jgi:hypothetical protein